MKKFYLPLLAALIGMSAQARELTFYIGDTEITDGQTIHFTDIELTQRGSTYTMTMAPELYISSDIFTDKLNVTATCTSGQEIQMCCGGNCDMGTTVSKKVTIHAKEKVALEFEYVLKPFNPDTDAVPVVTATIEAQDGNYSATHKSFTIVMSDNASVTLIENNNNLRTVPGAIEYTLSQPTRFALYNIDGISVLNSELNGNGSLSTAGLATGVYVYTLGEKSGKLLVK